MRSSSDPAFQRVAGGLQRLFSFLAFGDVDALHENADDVAFLIAHRLVDEINIFVFLAGAPGWGWGAKRRPCAVNAVPLQKHAVQKTEITLRHGVRQRLRHGASQYRPMANQVQIARIGPFKTMFRAAQHRHEGRGLVEQASQALLFQRPKAGAVGKHPPVISMQTPKSPATLPSFSRAGV